MVQAHDTGPNGVTVDDLVDKMLPYVVGLLRRIEGEEFTTNDFIELMLQVPETAAAYDAAGRAWGEQRRQTKQVLHGQVIPAALRKSGLVEWVGYAYGEADEYAIPGWWRLLPQDEA